MTDRPTNGADPCTCDHARDQHVTVSGRLLCDECEYDAPTVCREYTPADGDAR